jgi:hypothetical protein
LFWGSSLGFAAWALLFISADLFMLFVYLAAPAAARKSSDVKLDGG